MSLCSYARKIASYSPEGRSTGLNQDGEIKLWQVDRGSSDRTAWAVWEKYSELVGDIIIASFCKWALLWWTIQGCCERSEPNYKGVRGQIKLNSSRYFGGASLRASTSLFLGRRPYGGRYIASYSVAEYPCIKKVDLLRWNTVSYGWIQFSRKIHYVAIKSQLFPYYIIYWDLKRAFPRFKLVTGCHDHILSIEKIQHE